MRTDLTRRTFLAVALSGTALVALPGPAAALDISTARSLIDSLVVEVNRIINSGEYGRRFREFIGGQITVVDAHPLNENFEVVSVAKLRGQAPFDLRWWVSSKSGRDLFYNIIIEGVNMLATERTEIGAMLDQQNGDINALVTQLKVSG